MFLWGEVRPHWLPERGWAGGTLMRAAGSGAVGTLLHSGWEEPRCPAQAASPWLLWAEMRSLLPRAQKKDSISLFKEKKRICSKKIGNKQRWNENSLTSSNTTVRGTASECGQRYLVACWPVFVCCLSSWRRRLQGRPSRVGWAAGEETGCLSGRGGSRRCCGRLVLAKWSAAAPETEICCKKKMCAIRKEGRKKWGNKEINQKMLWPQNLLSLAILTSESHFIMHIGAIWWLYF